MVKEINKRIEKIIEHYNFSNSEFADEIDVQRSSISHVISGRNKPSLDFLIKVKDQFPDLSWDWLIKGEGNMMNKKEEPKEEKTPSSSLPNLFEMINQDNFGISEGDNTVNSTNPLESNIPTQDKSTTEISNSKSLEIKGEKEKKEEKTPVDNPENKIKRIVFFYENGKFESFEP